MAKLIAREEWGEINTGGVTGQEIRKQEEMLEKGKETDGTSGLCLYLLRNQALPWLCVGDTLLMLDPIVTEVS